MRLRGRLLAVAVAACTAIAILPVLWGALTHDRVPPITDIAGAIASANGGHSLLHREAALLLSDRGASSSSKPVPAWCTAAKRARGPYIIPQGEGGLSNAQLRVLDTVQVPDGRRVHAKGPALHEGTPVLLLPLLRGKAQYLARRRRGGADYVALARVFDPAVYCRALRRAGACVLCAGLPPGLPAAADAAGVKLVAEQGDEGDALLRAVSRPARRDSAEDFSRLNVQRHTALGLILIPAYCFALP